ncbi:hypothetical protein BHS06_12815 [Myxococcus xanthus]|nr:hypothetical protein BHS06_12815 [Myxococcus xanthus]
MYDARIIGSGAGGGPLALKFSQAGLYVLANGFRSADPIVRRIHAGDFACAGAGGRPPATRRCALMAVARCILGA